MPWINQTSKLPLWGRLLMLFGLLVVLPGVVTILREGEGGIGLINFVLYPITVLIYAPLLIYTLAMVFLIDFNFGSLCMAIGLTAVVIGHIWGSFTFARRATYKGLSVLIVSIFIGLFVIPYFF